MKTYLRWILPVAALLAVVAIVLMNTSGPERSAARYALSPNLTAPQKTQTTQPAALPRLLQLRGDAT